MVQAQIESIQGKGDWKGQHGDDVQFEVAFNDGTVGEANSKSQEPPYKVGDEVYYEVKSDNEGRARSSRSQRTHRPPEAFSSSNPPTQTRQDKQIIRGMCFKVAGMAWANQYKHKSFELPHEVMVKDVISLAKKYEKAFNEWMEE